MADERDEDRFDETEGKSGEQATTGQQGQASEFGKQGDQTGGQSATGQAQPGADSEPPRSMGTRGSEFGQFGEPTGAAGQQGQSGTGQSDLGSQADTTLAGRTDQQDLGQDQPATGEGFIGSQGSGSDDLVSQPENASSASATEGTDFASQGRGATDEDESGSEGNQS
jgi:hypothetical protein